MYLVAGYVIPSIIDSMVPTKLPHHAKQYHRGALTGWSVEVNDTELLGLDSEPTLAEVRRWPKELKEKRRALLYIKRLTRCRHRKNAAHKDMVEEKTRLEQELTIRLAEFRTRGVCHGTDRQSALIRELQRFVLEREVLREESVSLRQAIARYEKFQTAIQSASDRVGNTTDKDRTKEQSGMTVRFRESKWELVLVDGDLRVDFPGGEMPFFYHPFSREEFDAALHRQVSNLSGDISVLRYAGKFLGWEVYHAPLLLRPGSNILLGWAQYKIRLRRSIEAVKAAMVRDDGAFEWPIVATSRNLGFTGDVSVQTVQEFSEDACVLLRSHPGEINHRYLGLVERVKWSQVDGKRVLKYSFVIADSEANARSRDAEPTIAYNIRWINEGGSFLTISEVDDGTVDVVFDHWGCCENEQRAQSHFVTFGHLVTRWEQLVAPSKLLTF